MSREEITKIDAEIDSLERRIGQLRTEIDKLCLKRDAVAFKEIAALIAKGSAWERAQDNLVQIRASLHPGIVNIMRWNDGFSTWTPLTSSSTISIDQRHYKNEQIRIKTKTAGQMDQLIQELRIPIRKR